MSVIKKYQNPAGALPNLVEEWDKYASGVLGDLSFSKKRKKNETSKEKISAEQYAIAGLEKVKELLQGEGDNINNVVTWNKTAGTFNINLDKMKNQELKKKGIEYWSGSNQTLNSNMWGNLTAKDPGAYFGLGMGALQDFMEKRNAPVITTPSETPTVNGTSIGLSSFSKFMKNKYPDVTDYDPIIIGKTNEETQENLKNIFREIGTSYLAEANSNLTNKYIDKVKAETLLNTITGNNWEEINKKLYELGFDSKSVLKEPEQLEQEAKIATAKQEEINKNNFQKFITTKNFNSELVEPLWTSGYKNFYDENNIPEQYKNVPNINEIMKNGFLVNNPELNKYKLINKDTSKEYLYNDPDSGFYGSVFGYDKQDNLKYFTSDEYKKEFPSNTNFIYPISDDIRPMTGTIDGTSQKIFGVPQTINGKVIDTNELYIENPNDPTKPLELHKGEDGTYKDRNNIVHQVDITAYEPYDSMKKNTSHFILKNEMLKGDDFKSIPEIQSNRNVDDIVQEFLKTPPKSGTDMRRARLLGELKYHIKNNTWFSERKKASDRYQELLDYYNTNKEEYNSFIKHYQLNSSNSNNSKTPNMFWNSIKPTFIMKEGGIIKLQTGGINSIDDYNKKYRTQSTTDNTSLANQKSQRGTLRDMNNKDWISLGGSVLSFLPGVGAIGGAATTWADASNDIERTGKVNVGNLALNLGFTALGLIGLGGVGTAAKAARLARLTGKTVDEVSDAVRVIGKIDKLKNLSSESKTLLYKIGKGEATSLLGAAGGKGKVLAKETLEEIKQVSPLLEKIKSPTHRLPDKFIKELSTGIGKAEVAEKETLERIAAKATDKNWAQREFSGISNISTWAKEHKIAGNVVKAGLAAPMVVGGLSSVPSAISDIASGGFKNIQEQDLKNLLFSAGSVRELLKNKQLAKNITKLIGSEKENAFMTIKGVKYPVKQELLNEFKTEVPKETKSLLNKVGINKKGLEEANKKKVEKFGEYFEKYTGQKLPENTTLEDISSSVSNKTTFNKTAKESGLSLSEHKEALQVIEDKWKRRGLPTWFMKEGGTLKLQLGKKVSKPSDYTKTKKTWKLGDISDNSTPILNTIMYGIGTINNAQINRKGNEALIKGFTLEPMAKRRNIPLATFNSFETEKEASKVDQMGRRIAESSSNLDQGLKARLAASEQSSGLRLQGKLKDQEYINNLRREQFTSDATIDEYNLGATGRNQQRFGELNKNLALNEVNKILSNNTNLQNFVTAQNEFIKNKREETESKEKDKLLANALMGPEYKKALADYTAFGGTDYLEKVRKEILGTKTVGEIKDYTTDQRWLDAVEKSKSAGIRFKAEQDRIQNLILMTRSFPNLSIKDMGEYSSVKRKGGSLEDKLILEDKKLSGKIVLENLKYKQKKALKEAEEAIKSISKNNELLQKSLIKIFK
jgi:hypothetical protein